MYLRGRILWYTLMNQRNVKMPPGGVILSEIKGSTKCTIKSSDINKSDAKCMMYFRCERNQFEFYAKTCISGDE